MQFSDADAAADGPALIEYLDLFYNLRRSARVMKRMGAIDFVTTLAPGLRDVLLTGKVKERTNERQPDGSQSKRMQKNPALQMSGGSAQRHSNPNLLHPLTH